MTISMPPQNPGSSFQGYETPDDFLKAAKLRLHIEEFSVDLAAADFTVAKARRTYTPEENSLLQPWDHEGWQWCNPPFDALDLWTRKASEAEGNVAMLVPASIGANWWRDFVHGKAYVLAVNGRVTFVGEVDPYPKDLALLLYGPDIVAGYEIWTWKNQR